MNFPNALRNAILLASLSPLAVQAVVVPLTADTNVALPNVGAAQAINIRPATKALLAFDLSTLPGGITSGDIAKATLVFYVKTAPVSGKIQASPVTQAWNETTVTAAPTQGAAAASSAVINRGNTYFALDVTNLVLDWVDIPASNKGLVLEPDSSTPAMSITLDSKEAIQTSHPAYIEIALKGPAGAVGAKGDKGDKGDTGAPGLAGANGLTTSVNGVTQIAGAITLKTTHIGLGNVDNTSDANKPVSTATQNALAGKANLASPTFTGVPVAPTATAGTDTNQLATTAFANNAAGVHAIGESYGGGIVFYVYDSGRHGLIAATTDQSASILWYNGTYRVTGTTGDGAGAMNTAMIVATQISDTPAGNFAAKVCADYAVTVGGVTYGDWYLPSKLELNLMYQNIGPGAAAPLTNAGGFASSHYYWSSSERSGSVAWYQNFGSGVQYVGIKNFTFYVRAARAF
ncbi:MAG: DNRLRE domain-containing protein [Methylovulum miyakonense]|uniref:DNRLRE domain-containing protein n=1 Tax=Methylovulum miyakonense TaxID=645578 RepID=UPI003BB4B5AE